MQRNRFYNGIVSEIKLFVNIISFGLYRLVEKYFLF